MIRAIAAIDRERGIGRQGKMPWKLPTDERYFTEQTKKYGAQVLTGRTTFDLTYHGPLKERTNYILTHSPEPIPGVVVVNDLAAFIANLQGDLWIAGGDAVFTQAMPWTDELYLTLIDGVFGCDRFFPAYEHDYRLVSQSSPLTENGLTYTFCVFTKK